MKRLLLLATTMMTLALAPACGGKSDSGGKAGGGKAANAAQKRADKVWFENCQTCHGPEGKGDGAAARNLNPKPRSFGDAAWQKKVTDAQIKRVIVKGGESIGLSKSMPPTPTLATDKGALEALVAKIRGYGKK